MRSDAASAGAHALRSITWDLVVADEAQHIKSPASSTAKALRTIEAHARIALSGTPVENNLTELWAILDWAVPGLLGSRNRSEEHTSELQSLMRISYADFCLKKKKKHRECCDTDRDNKTTQKHGDH